MTGKDRDLDAAERAIGTLPRKGESARARREREAWEYRLAALLRPVEPVNPPSGMFARISEHLAHGDTYMALRRTQASARRWRGISAIAGLAVIGLAAALVAPILSPSEQAAPAETPRYVAVVTSAETGEPGMVVEFNTATGIATVIPVGATAPEDHAFEMWRVPADESAPISLGLLPDEPALHRDIDAGPGDIFAISVEAPDGSATGQPTDARYFGQIVRIE